MDGSSERRKFTPEEKQQLLDNLDIEVEHRVRQFEAWLADALENFRIHQEGLISRIPHVIRNMPMREFAEKYDGDIEACLRGLQKEKMGDVEQIDKTTRKRKWVAAQEAEAEASGLGAESKSTVENSESSRAVKMVPRMMSATPKKAPGSSTGPGTIQRARLVGNKTVGTSRTMGRPTPSPSPNKFHRVPSGSVRPPPRPISPSKRSYAQGRRPPSSTTFNPVLPKTPAFPDSHNARLPKRGESMLSLNGSPLANPYELGLKWFAGGGTQDDGEDDVETDNSSSGKGKGKGKEKVNTLKRSNSIVIRRDPSFSFGPSLVNGFHSRANPHTSILQHDSSTTHSRSNSQQPHSTAPATPPAKPPAFIDSLSSSHVSAMVAIPTKDGHLLEFDPLLTSPGALDALEGITDSAKKQAREEMAILVQTAVAKWKIS